MCVDDFGCFSANVKLIKSSLFPLITDEIEDDEIIKWLRDCKNAGLILFYEVNGKHYLQINDFKQRLRQARKKYPLPIDGQLSDNWLTDDSQLTDYCSPETKRNETESESESETETNLKPKRADKSADVWPTFSDFWERYDKHVGKSKTQKLWERITQGAREKIMKHLEYYTLKGKRYRKDPERYLENETWKDEVIITTPQNATDKRQQHVNDLKSDFANRVIASNKGK
jgi:hypothetical protein